jgi:spermidine synthase
MSIQQPALSNPAVQQRGLQVYLLATAGLCGAMVMVVEVLGSRVIGPFFGVSLFVWTSLITVTLLALAVGYAIGGRMADRNCSPTRLYAVVMAAGLCILAVPFIQLTVLKSATSLGLRLGSLVSAAILFGPALLLLGCVSPLLVRLLAREMHNLGRTVGGLYALSTAGSFAGTIITGFFLIGVVGVSRIFMLSGLLLILLGAGYFIAFRRSWAGLGALLLIPSVFMPAPLPARTLADGTMVRVIEKRDSFYGNLRVVDYRYGDKQTRELSIDGLIQGGVAAENGLSVYEYPYLLQFLPREYHAAGRTCLVIGLGAGIVPRWYHEQGIATTVVDIDPEVANLARRHFGFPDGIPIHIQDARQYLIADSAIHDYIVLDVFNGDTTPGHLLSQEALRLVKSRLAENGVLAINLVGSLDHETFVTASVMRTLQSVFDHVEIYPVIPASAAKRYGNLVVIAYQGEQRVPARQMHVRQPIHPLASDLVQLALNRRFSFPAGTPAMILTDDFNPIDLRDLWIKEEVRRVILETTHPDILLG